MKRIALVSGFEGVDEAGPGLSVARALKDAHGGAVRCIAVVGSPIVPAAWMADAVDDVMVAPDWRMDPAAAVRRWLPATDADTEIFAVPGSTTDALALVSHRSELATCGVRVHLPAEAALELLDDPDALKRRLARAGISMPDKVVAETSREVERYAPVLAYPHVVEIAGQNRVMKSQAQLLSVLRQMRVGPEEAIRLSPHVEADDYRAAGIARNGRFGPLVAVRVTNTTKQGGIAAVSVVVDDEVLSLARRAARELDWTGPLEFEFGIKRSHGATEGYPMLRAVHCRLPGWSAAAAWAGLNLPALYAEFARGMDGSDGHGNARPGTIALRTTREANIDSEIIAGLRDGGLAAVPRKRTPVRVASKRRARIAVTGLSTSDVVNPGIGVARALAQADTDFELIGIGYAASDAGAFEPGLFARVYRMDYPASAGQLLRQIEAITESGGIDALIPCLDGELPYYIRNREQLEAMGIATLMPTMDAFRARSKLSLFSDWQGRDFGCFTVPRSDIVARHEDLRSALTDFGVPAILKGPDCGCEHVSTFEEADRAWGRLSTTSEPAMILQQPLSGPCFAVSAVVNEDHSCVSAFTMRKEATCARGSTWSAECVPFAELERDFAAFMRELRWTGPCEGEFMFDAETRRFHLFEVNPRFTGWISASAPLGINQPEMVARMALGMPSAVTRSPRSQYFMRAADELLVSPTRMSALTTKGVLRHAS
ncbi:MAG: hypothetical protein QNJ91_13790 [Gammaproteobacteria bacterium]|nr:hypothetical protein [Gammaproteobacteria bacterium]